MFPVICKIGPLTIYSYGLMLAIAVVICSYFLSKDAIKAGLSKEIIYDLSFWVVIFGIIGARIFYIILNLDFFLEKPSEIIMVQNGGLAWQGSLAGGFIAGAFFIKRKKLKFFQILDLSAPYLALGQSIGRIGCFLNGCCYGKELSWGIYSSVHNSHLHPTQLYSSAGLFVVFLVLKKYQKKEYRPGQAFVRYLFLASLLRFIIEFFRGDHNVLIFGLSVYQYVCILIFSSALLILSRLKKSG